jgi:hypothetical protein
MVVLVARVERDLPRREQLVRLLTVASPALEHAGRDQGAPLWVADPLPFDRGAGVEEGAAAEDG